MKTLVDRQGFKSISLVVLICSLFIIGCEQDRFLSGPVSKYKSEHSTFSAKVEISPSMATDVLLKTQEDWQNINDALQNAGPGDVVELQAGLFYLHKSIIRWDFSGTIRGAGKDKTTIQTAPGITFDVSDVPSEEWDDDWTSEGNTMLCFPHQFTNEERTVIVSDITIVGNEPCTPWVRDVNGSSPTTHNTPTAVSVYYEGLDNDWTKPIRLNVIYKDIAVMGIEDPRFNSLFGTNFSMAGGLVAAGASNGAVVVEDIHITNTTVCMAFHIWNGEGSTVSVSNSRGENTRYGIWSEICHSWIVSNNEFKNCSNSGIFLSTWGLSNGSSIIKDNELENCSINGIVMYGPANGGVIIEDNLLIMDARWNAIYGRDLNNVRVLDNTFTGNSYSGILARRGDNWEIKDNNLCDLIVSHPESATVRLDRTFNSIVTGNKNQVVGESAASDPSNYIGDAKECEIE